MGKAKIQLQVADQADKEAGYPLLVNGRDIGIRCGITNDGMYCHSHEIGNDETLTEQQVQQILQMEAADFPDRLELFSIKKLIKYGRKLYISVERRAGLFGVYISINFDQDEPRDEFLIWQPELFLKRLREKAMEHGLLIEAIWEMGSLGFELGDTFFHQSSVEQGSINDKIEEGLAILDKCIHLVHQEFQQKFKGLEYPFVAKDQ